MEKADANQMAMMTTVVPVLLGVIIALLAFIYKRLTEQLAVVKAYNHNLVTVMFKLLAALHPTQAPLITEAMAEVMAQRNKGNGAAQRYV